MKNNQQWDLTQLYKNLKDPKILKDCEFYSKQVKKFSKKYNNADTFKNEANIK